MVLINISLVCLSHLHCAESQVSALVKLSGRIIYNGYNGCNGSFSCELQQGNKGTFFGWVVDIGWLELEVVVLLSMPLSMIKSRSSVSIQCRYKPHKSRQLVVSDLTQSLTQSQIVPFSQEPLI